MTSGLLARQCWPLQVLAARWRNCFCPRISNRRNNTMARYDVVIIGGAIVGSSIAYYLRDEGFYRLHRADRARPAIRPCGDDAVLRLDPPAVLDPRKHPPVAVHAFPVPAAEGRVRPRRRHRLPRRRLPDPRRRERPAHPQGQSRGPDRPRAPTSCSRTPGSCASASRGSRPRAFPPAPMAGPAKAGSTPMPCSACSARR